MVTDEENVDMEEKERVIVREKGDPDAEDWGDLDNDADDDFAKQKGGENKK